MATGGTELCVFLLHLHLHLHIYIYICHKVSREVGERREGIRGLCWQLVELLEDKFLARLPALPKLMPNILRRGKHKKLSSLNRRRGPEKIIVILHQKKLCVSQFCQYIDLSYGGCFSKYLSHSRPVLHLSGNFLATVYQQ